MEEKLKIIDENDNNIEILLTVASGDEKFQNIRNFIIDNFNCLPSDEVDDIFYKRVFFSKGGVKFQLLYDDLFGNTLIGETAEAKQLVIIIAKKITNEFTE